MFYSILPNLLPIVIAIAVGYAWVRSGKPFENSTLTPLAADLAMSCLVFSTLAKSQIPVGEFVRTAGAALMCLTVLACVGAAMLYASRLKLRTYLPSVTWGNAGFLGVPLALYAFGPIGFGHAVAFSATSLVFNSVFGQVVSAGRANGRAILRAPLIYAICAGVLVPLLHLPLPAWVTQSTSLIGGMAVPLMLMMVGASLARLKVTAIGRAVAFSIFRSVIGAVVGLFVASLFALNDTARAVLVMQCAMPVAVLSYILAQRWDNDPEEVAGLVVVSTWASVITIPVLLHLLAASPA